MAVEAAQDAPVDSTPSDERTDERFDDARAAAAGNKCSYSGRKSLIIVTLSCSCRSFSFVISFS